MADRNNNAIAARPLRVIYTCFPGGKHKALTMSYDDGRPEDRRLVALFNEYGIKGTFNLNGMLTRDGRILPEEMETLYKGHEVACHTALRTASDRARLSSVLCSFSSSVFRAKSGRICGAENVCVTQIQTWLSSTPSRIAVSFFSLAHSSSERDVISMDTRANGVFSSKKNTRTASGCTCLTNPSVGKKPRGNSISHRPIPIRIPSPPAFAMFA
mgnify:CR=1 FL=1